MDFNKLLEALRLMLEIPVKNASDKYPLVTFLLIWLLFLIVAISPICIALIFK